MDPSGAGREGADHAGLPRPCGGGNTHSHTPYAQTVGARPGRDLGAFGGVILALTATTVRAHTMASRLVLQRFDPDASTLSRAVQNALRYVESCEVVIDGDCRNGCRGCGGLRARGLEPAA